MRVAREIKLTKSERNQLEALVSSRSTPVRLVERSRIVLLAAQGWTNQEIAQGLGVDKNKVGRWRKRYAEGGLKAIEKELPRGNNHGGSSPGSDTSDTRLANS